MDWRSYYSRVVQQVIYKHDKYDSIDFHIISSQLTFNLKYTNDISQILWYNGIKTVGSYIRLKTETWVAEWIKKFNISQDEI